MSYNATHTTLSFFDNSGPEHRNGSSSRGMLVQLRTDVEPMTARLLAEFPHPRGPGLYVQDFGSMQILPDGNVFVGWVDGLLISEHDSSRKLLMEAHAQEGQEWIKTSRAYKFPFLGQPAQPPDAYAEVSREDGDIRTTVHVSWNGATEVKGWNVYSTTQGGGLRSGQLVAEAPKEGFETRIEVAGDAGFVVVEAVDGEGKEIGRSDVFLAEGSMTQPSEEIVEESDEKMEVKLPEADTFTQADSKTSSTPISTASSSTSSWKDTAKTHSNSILSLLAALAAIAGAFFLVRYWLRRRRSSRSWTAATGANGHRRKPSDHELLARQARGGGYAVVGEEEEEDEEGYEGWKEGRER